MTEREEFVGRMSLVSRFPQYLCSETSNEGNTTLPSGEIKVSLYASDVNWSGYGSLVNRHCLEILGGSEGEVGRCTHSYSAAVDANSARVKCQ